jgi:hypothetical protein
MIAFNKRNSTMDCRVREVHLTNTAIVPDQFDLTIARKEALSARAWSGAAQ